MVKSSKRALRRHHRARLIARTTTFLERNTLTHNPDLTSHVLRRYNNVTSCSCHMCCNVRHNPWLSGDEHLTLQERKFLDSYKDQIDEYYEGHDNE